MAKHKKWSASAKFEIALLALRGDHTIQEICHRHQVAPSQVHKWKKQLIEQGSNVFAKNDNSSERSTAAELERMQGELYRKIGELTVERDFLKKSWEKHPGNGD